MSPSRNMVKARNLLVGAGAYYLAAWLTTFLAIGYNKLIQGIVYSGGFESAIVMPLVLHLPKAIVAAATGAAVVWLVESERPITWVIFPVLLYAVLGFLGYHWAQPPGFLDWVEQTVAALFPAVTCAFGATMAARRRTRPHPGQIAPH